MEYIEIKRKMTLWLPDWYEHFIDCFASLSDPIEFLLALSRELLNHAKLLQEEFTQDYVDDYLQICREYSSGECAIYHAYKETAEFARADVMALGANTTEFLSTIYKHKDMLSSVTEVSTIVLEAIGILELLANKAFQAVEWLEYSLSYSMYEHNLDLLCEMHGQEAISRFKKINELTLNNYVVALDEIRKFMKYIDQNQISVRLAELGLRLRAYCETNTSITGKIQEITRKIEEKEFERLLQSDIAKAIIGAFGTEKLKRLQIITKIQYEDGGHIGATLANLKRYGILLHKRPYYWINPKWYDRFDICPDKDGQ